MLDRIDIHIEVPRMDFEKLSDNRRGEASDEIRARVEAARQRQRERFAGLSNGVMMNADMRVAEVRQICELDDATPTIRTSISSYFEIITHDCGFSWRGEHPIYAFSRGFAV